MNIDKRCDQKCPTSQANPEKQKVQITCRKCTKIAEKNDVVWRQTLNYTKAYGKIIIAHYMARLGSFFYFVKMGGKGASNC